MERAPPGEIIYSIYRSSRSRSANTLQAIVSLSSCVLCSFGHNFFVAPTTRDRPFASRLARRAPCRHRSHPNARDERALLQRVQRPKIRKSPERRQALVAAVAAAAVAEVEAAAAAEAQAQSQRRLVARRDAQRPRSRPVQPQLPPRRVCMARQIMVSTSS